jgi:hypothetical protein
MYVLIDTNSGTYLQKNVSATVPGPDDVHVIVTTSVTAGATGNCKRSRTLLPAWRITKQNTAGSGYIENPHWHDWVTGKPTVEVIVSVLLARYVCQ